MKRMKITPRDDIYRAKSGSSAAVAYRLTVAALNAEYLAARGSKESKEEIKDALVNVYRVMRKNFPDSVTNEH